MLPCYLDATYPRDTIVHGSNKQDVLVKLQRSPDTLYRSILTLEFLKNDKMVSCILHKISKESLILRIILQLSCNTVQKSNSFA